MTDDTYAADLVRKTYEAGGPYSVLSAFEELSPEDRALIRPRIEEVIPAQMVERGADHYKIAVSKAIRELDAYGPIEQIALLGPPDAAFLGSLAFDGYRGRVRMVPGADMDAADAVRVRRNVPPNLHIRFDFMTERAVLPTVREVVFAIGFDGGADMVVTDRHVPAIAKQLCGHGQVYLLRPHIGAPVFERTTVFAAASRRLFRPDPLRPAA